MKHKQSQSFKSLIIRLFTSSRPISWINTAFPFVAGYLAAGGLFTLQFWLTAFFFLIPYNVLIYVVNDVFDYESDKRNPRKNSIEGGLLAPETHRFMLCATAAMSVPILLWLLVLGATSANVLLVAIVLGAVSYSVPPLRLKERPVFDSLNSSFHFVGPLIYALVLTGFQQHYWWYITAFFAWGCASHAFGAVQDIRADRAASIRSIATWLGAARTVRASFMLYSVAIGAVILSGWPALLVAFPLLGYIKMVLPFIHLTDAKSEDAHDGWRQFLLINQLTGFVITIVLLSARFL